MGTYILAVDLGTSSVRAVLFAKSGDIYKIAQCPYALDRPQNGYAEQDALVLWDSTCQVVSAQLSFALSLTDHCARSLMRYCLSALRDLLLLLVSQTSVNQSWPGTKSLESPFPRRLTGMTLVRSHSVTN
jgi:FGGY family of carbohydrate kinases, N-terminal domain